MNYKTASTHLFLFVFLGCIMFMCSKKDQAATHVQESDHIEKKFFTTNRTQNGDEKVLVDYLIRQQQKSKFVEKTVAQIGYPRWDKMIVLKRKGNKSGRGESDSSVTSYYIPFVRDSQQFVNASMIINTTANDTSFGYRCDWEYQNKSHGSPAVDTTAEGHATFFMFFDYITFGYTEFYLTDDELFPLSQPIIGGKKKLSFLSISTQSTGKGQSAGYYENCVDFYVCGSPSSPTCTGPGGCDYLNCPLPPGSPGYCYLVTTVCVGGWQDPTGGSSGSTGSGSSTGSGGGGNNGGGTPPPCPGTSTSQRGQTAVYGCGPGWNGIGNPPTDPCLTAQPVINSLNTLFQNATVTNAIASIHAQDSTREHSISLGRDANGNITASSITSGGPSSGTVNTSWPGGFADVHNHPSNNEPSPGDLYMIMGLYRSRPGWNTRIVSNRNGETYALVVVDTTAAKTFRNNNFIIDPLYGPIFSDEIFEKFKEVSGYFQQQGYHELYSDERALAYILDKYNSGVIFLKKEGATFKRLRTSTGPQNGTYDTNDCN
jgi:hypothetical protein